MADEIFNYQRINKRDEEIKGQRERLRKRCIVYTYLCYRFLGQR